MTLQGFAKCGDIFSIFFNCEVKNIKYLPNPSSLFTLSIMAPYLKLYRHCGWAIGTFSAALLRTELHYEESRFWDGQWSSNFCLKLGILYWADSCRFSIGVLETYQDQYGREEVEDHSIRKMEKYAKDIQIRWLQSIWKTSGRYPHWNAGTLTEHRRLLDTKLQPDDIARWKGWIIQI